MRAEVNPTAQQSRWVWGLLALILLGSIAVRLPRLQAPPVDYHSYRQTETAALARNYAEEGFRLFYPTVDWRGDSSGYVESELSLYAYLSALGYGLVGFNEVIPRLISIVASTITALLLFTIAKIIWNWQSGLLAAFAYSFLSPFGIFFGRAIMGDMCALMLITMTIFAAVRWADGASVWYFWLAIVTATLAGLSKLPALHVGLPLAILIYSRDGSALWRKPRNCLGAVVVLGIVAGWYWHAYRLGQQTGLSFGILDGSKTGNLSLLLDGGYYRYLLQNLSTRILTTSGLALAVIGLLLPRRHRFELALLGWLGGSVVYFLYAAPGVLNQDYYVLSVLPPLALYLGKAAWWLLERGQRWLADAAPRRWLAGMALLLVVPGVVGRSAVVSIGSAWQLTQPHVSVQGNWAAGRWVQAVVPPDAQLVNMGGSSPEVFYFSNRNGLGQPESGMDSLVAEGREYAIYFNPYYGGFLQVPEAHRRWRVLGGGEWFLLYDLQQARDAPPETVFSPVPQWQNEISLLGYDMNPDHLVDNRLYLVLHWQADEVPSGRYTGLVHAWNSDGNFCGQDDHQVLNAWYPTTQWQAGELVLDPFQIDVSACPDETTFRLSAGLYHTENGERLVMTSATNEDQLHWFEASLAEPSRSP